MNRTVWIAVITICALVVVFAFRFSPRPTDLKQSNRTSNPSTQAGGSGLGASNSQPAPMLPAAVPSIDRQSGILTNTQSQSAPNFATGDARQRQTGASDTALLAVKGMLRDYRARLGENPIGNNAEVTKALLGGNPRGVQFSDAQMKLDRDGQLIDRWNHPYFFHQLARTDMEVRSAGPDGILWTTDDEVSP